MSANTEKKEWTLMFYFASDNPLAPSIVSQLKAIKDAGFHQKANVIAHFDPHTKGTASHTFDVNLVNKLKDSKKLRRNFTANDPFVRNLAFDRLWGEGDEKVRTCIQEFLKRDDRKGNKRRNGKPINYNPPIPKKELSCEPTPKVALEKFLDFCRNEYPAHHYMLFILGHGIVVGNDIFLYDENTLEEDDNSPARNSKKRENGKSGKEEKRSLERNSLLLKDLGDVLKRFKRGIGEDSDFDLIGFHSCSMSALEVAYQLQGTANYMLASQGPAFVGSWPYRQILIRVFNDLQLISKKVRRVKEVLDNIFDFCVFNSYDFQLAGYSYDMCLCDLTKLKDKEKGIKTPLKKLSSALHDGLDDPLVKGLILLAHWDAQSYWQEQYTDLYDFCLRLHFRCEPYESANPMVQKIRTACFQIMEVLKIDLNDDDRLIVRSESVGPEYQYSHGLSVFFPWSRPVDDFFEKQYKKEYLFKETSWGEFLDKYFRETQRKMRAQEDDPMAAKPFRRRRTRNLIEKEILDLAGVISNKVFNNDGQLSKGGGGDSTGKGGGGDASGDDCSCPSIKNYPSLTREIRKDRPIDYAEEPKVSFSPKFAEQFVRQLKK